MTICDIQIRPQDSNNWTLRVNTTRIATPRGENSHNPISPFDLGINLRAKYIGVAINIVEGRPTWKFGGLIAQVYPFDSNTNVSPTGTVQNRQFPLAVNRVQLISLDRVAPSDFSLFYYPPTWFKDVTVRVWQYTGEEIDFGGDTLLEIKDSIDEVSSTSLTQISDEIEQLRVQQLLSRDAILDEILLLIQRIETLSQESLQQFNELDAGLFSLAEGISQLLPTSEGTQLKNNVTSRTNLDLDFL